MSFTDLGCLAWLLGVSQEEFLAARTGKIPSSIQKFGVLATWRNKLVNITDDQTESKVHKALLEAKKLAKNQGKTLCPDSEGQWI